MIFKCTLKHLVCGDNVSLCSDFCKKNSYLIYSKVYLPEYMAALKVAGVDKLLAEMQKQLDEWVKKNKLK